MPRGDTEGRDGQRSGAPVPWKTQDMKEAFAELEHPADLLLEVRGTTLPQLFENALYGLYYHLADLSEIDQEQTLHLEAQGTSLEDALRSLLAEAVYSFDTQGFVASGAEVVVTEARQPGDAAQDDAADAQRGWVYTTARLIGGMLGPSQAALTEVKAVTYHQLAVGQTEDGRWRATVLFDV